MFGSIGFPELVLIFVVVLLLFGPDRLPGFARTLGKTIREFRATVDEAKSVIEKEIGVNDVRGDLLDLKRNVGGDLLDMKRSVRDMVNGVLADAAVPAAPPPADPYAAPAAEAPAEPAVVAPAVPPPAEPAPATPPPPPADEKAQ